MLVILSLVGTRPEAIKMAPVIKELGKYRDRIRSVVCTTGQHREMLDKVLEVFEIHPDHDLAVMQPDQMLSPLTAELFTRLDPVVEETKPDWILAQGDTTTVLVGALASYYRRIRFGHVEAGLRTGDKFRPYPEEMNRRIADLLADALFAPTERSRENLLREGVPNGRILVTGNTAIDALMATVARGYDWGAGPLAGLPVDRKLVLVTAHRRENFGAGLREICCAIKELALRFESQGIQFVYPVHLNPNVRRPVKEILSGLSNVTLMEPLDYFSMVHLMKRSTLILTDSGGIQEEAPSVGVPVLVMRDTTERPEGIEAGVSRLVGTSRNRIVKEVASLLEDRGAYGTMISRVNPYGDGRAASRIVSFLLERLSI
jgi:UDP-N-acetylglucosamine 2-epimerase